jgi:predicted O-methyltransferase YrrM
MSDIRDNFMREIELKARERYIPIISPEIGQLFSVLIKSVRPKRILEIGTAIGYSTIWMARAAGPTVEVVTIEIDEERAREARENFQHYNLENRINLKLGDALEIIPYLHRKFDFVFIDAAKGQYLNYLELLMEIVPAGGLIIADNVLYRGYVRGRKSIKHKHRTMVNVLREYLETVTDHHLLETSVLPVGDGIAISVKKEEPGLAED